MTKDIREYEPKMFGVITRRQLLFLLLGLVFAIPTVLLIPGELMTRIMIGTVVMVPFAACGWVRVYDMNLEDFAKQVIRASFILPVKRKYKIESSVAFLEPKNTSQQKPKIKPSPEYKPHK